MMQVLSNLVNKGSEAGIMGGSYRLMKDLPQKGNHCADVPEK